MCYFCCKQAPNSKGNQMTLIKFIKKLDINGQEEKRKYTMMFGDPIMGDVTKQIEVKDKDGNKTVKDITVQQVVGWNGEPRIVKDMELIYAPGSNKYDNMLAFVEKCSEVLGDPFNDFEFWKGHQNHSGCNSVHY